MSAPHFETVTEPYLLIWDCNIANILRSRIKKVQGSAIAVRASVIKAVSPLGDNIPGTVFICIASNISKIIANQCDLVICGFHRR